MIDVPRPDTSKKAGGDQATDHSDQYENENDPYLIKIRLSREGIEAIEKEFNDVEFVYDEIKNTRVVEKLSDDFESWKDSEEFEKLRKLNEQFVDSTEG